MRISAALVCEFLWKLAIISRQNQKQRYIQIWYSLRSWFSEIEQDVYATSCTISGSWDPNATMRLQAACCQSVLSSCKDNQLHTVQLQLLQLMPAWTVSLTEVGLSSNWKKNSTWKHETIKGFARLSYILSRKTDTGHCESWRWQKWLMKMDSALSWQEFLQTIMVVSYLINRQLGHC
jgi:hypothetical protein